jgi:hypothetical protein
MKVLKLFIWIVPCLAIAIIFSCAEQKKVTTMSDAERAAKRWPGFTQEMLTHGQELYETKCARCHMLYKPASRSEQEWKDVMVSMARKAKLKNDEKELIEQYLFTMREKPTQQKM